MVATRSWRTRAVGALASMAMLVGIAGPVAAADPAYVLDLPAGTACGFELQLAVYGGTPQVNKDFGDGIVLAAGKGSAITYTNVGTGDSISTKAGGAASWTVSNEDGGLITLTGSNVVILFPTDVGGPSTTVYTGRVVIDVASDGTWAVRTSPPTALDVCAALS